MNPLRLKVLENDLKNQSSYPVLGFYSHLFITPDFNSSYDLMVSYESYDVS